MKIKLTNKKVWKTVAENASFVPGIMTLLMSFIDFSKEVKYTMGIELIIITLIIVFIAFYQAEKTISKSLKIRNTTVILKFGDLFNEEGRKVIAFNEYFDTQVDNVIINEESLNGKVVKKLGQTFIDNVLNNDSRLQMRIEENNCTRINGGKSVRYRLGTTCLCEQGENKFFLVAFSKFDDDNKAYHTVETYVSCLMNMWKELDGLYAQKKLVMPLLGSGITRFDSENISNQTLLEMIVWTFRQSRVNFISPATLTIVLPEDKKNEINLYEID